MNQQTEFDWTAEAEAEERGDEVPRSATGTASEKVLDRIKKLLRLAADKRGNPAEAEAAASRAFDLADRYHVDVAMLDLSEEIEKLIGEYFPLGSRLDRISNGALIIVRQFFNVEPCLSFPRVLFVGRTTDVAIAGYVYEFLRRACRDCRSAYEKAEKAARRRVTTIKRGNYITGFFWGIASNLDQRQNAMQLDSSKTALVLAEKVKRDEKLKDLVPDTETKSLRDVRRNHTAAMAGWRDGKKTQITKPIGGATAREALALPG